jgi:NAD+ diphosphatase
VTARYHRWAPNFYASGGLERAAERRRDEAWLAAQLIDPRTRFLPVWRAQNLVLANGAAGEAPAPAFLAAEQAAALLSSGGEAAFLGLVGEVAHFALAVPESGEEPPAVALGGGAAFMDLRAVGPLLGRDEGSLLAYARGLVHWHTRHRFCGVCGSPTESTEAGHVRRCTNASCGAQHFPRTDPAVIMLVSDGAERCILGRQRVWPPGMHSVLAGFVEPGESLEDAVAREVFEEVGVAVSDVTYHSSQPWPFPASIMLGFYARAASDVLNFNAEELELARWFTRAEMRASPEDETFRLPRRDSIARRLLEDWLAAG